MKNPFKCSIKFLLFTALTLSLFIPCSTFSQNETESLEAYKDSVQWLKNVVKNRNIDQEEMLFRFENGLLDIEERMINDNHLQSKGFFREEVNRLNELKEKPEDLTELQIRANLNKITKKITAKIDILENTQKHLPEFYNYEEGKVRLEKILSKPEFNKVMKRENPFLQKLRNFIMRLLNSLFKIDIDDEKVLPVINVLLYFFVIFVVCLILYLIAKRYIFIRKVNEDNVDENILKTEYFDSNTLNTLFNNQVKAKEFRKALRTYFLYLISCLEDNRIVQLDRTYTNNEYAELVLSRITTSKCIKIFDRINKLFEIKWYGLNTVLHNELKLFQQLVDNFVREVIKH